jgi:hypothetical protein
VVLQYAKHGGIEEVNRAWNRKLPRHPGKSARERKLFIVVLVCVAVPTIGTVATILRSSRTDLFFAKFPAVGPDGTTAIMDWGTVSKLAEGMESFGSMTVPARFDSLAQVPGYMLPFGQQRYGELVDAFLLVPDPGNWIHPPHLERGEVIVVQMEAGKSVRLLEKQAVWVRGKMSIAPLKTNRLDALFRMKAVTTWEFEAPW